MEFLKLRIIKGNPNFRNYKHTHNTFNKLVEIQKHMIHTGHKPQTSRWKLSYSQEKPVPTIAKIKTTVE